jgi:hypothetical protein
MHAKFLPSTRRRPGGFSNMEVLISVLLVSAVLIGATKLLGNVVRSRTLLASSARAQQYAQQLMAEVMNMAYKEGALLGPDLTILPLFEARADFDDVDDFHGWVETPLQDRAGAIIPNTTGWRRTASVSWVSTADPKTVVGSDQGVKRVTITVERNGTVLAQLIGLRTDVYP